MRKLFAFAVMGFAAVALQAANETFKFDPEANQDEVMQLLKRAELDDDKLDLSPGASVKFVTPMTEAFKMSFKVKIDEVPEKGFFGVYFVNDDTKTIAEIMLRVDGFIEAYAKQDGKKIRGGMGKKVAAMQPDVWMQFDFTVKNGRIVISQDGKTVAKGNFKGIPPITGVSFWTYVAEYDVKDIVIAPLSAEAPAAAPAAAAD